MTTSDGVSRWRQVGDALMRDIEQGVLHADARLPKAQDLAARFGVNRHTVLRALSHLQSRGFVRIERSRGAQVLVNPLQYRIGARHWFEQNLLENAKTPSRRVLSVIEIPADARVATALELQLGETVVRVVLLGEADGMPVNFNTHYLPPSRLPGVAQAFRAFGNETTESLSFSAIFCSLGVSDWHRRTVRIRSRPPTDDEIRLLRMPPADHVMETEVTSVDGTGRPLVHALTSFCSSRIEFVLDLDQPREP